MADALKEGWGGEQCGAFPLDPVQDMSPAAIIGCAAKSNSHAFPLHEALPGCIAASPFELPRNKNAKKHA